jgi:sodium transport system ATP-binding protein
MDASTQARVQVEGLSKVFRGPKRKQIKAVDGVSFEARAGEIFGLLGANGAGKTTTLRVLSTMLVPSAGDACICGFSVRQKPEEVRRRIGFLSTATSLYGRLTAREMVTYFGRLHGMAPATLEARRRELFELFGMQGFADVRCDKLSTGMKQKVSIVRSVLHDPEVMIFDEPTAGLDVLTSRTIVSFVRDCRARGKCVIFSTHIMDEVEQLCDRVGVIHAGRVLACEPLQALRDRAPSGRVGDAFVALVEAAGVQP